MPQTFVRIVADMSELETDLERLANGKLSLPTVSAVSVFIDDTHIEEIPIYLEEK
jgi:hypothetical protein